MAPVSRNSKEQSTHKRAQNIYYGKTARQIAVDRRKVRKDAIAEAVKNAVMQSRNETVVKKDI